MSKLSKSLNKHLTHEVKVVFTPGKIHYAKLCCVDCGNLFLNWLSPDQLVQIGQINETQKQTLIKEKKPKVQALQNQGKYKKKQSWSNIGTQERNFYKSYQPASQQKGRTPSQLVKDRLCLEGYSKHNGNSVYSLPIDYLQSLLDTNKINNTDDRHFIMDAIKKRTGTDLGPSESNKQHIA